MKVAIIGSKGFDTIEYHTVDALKHLGHEVFHLDMSDFLPFKYLHNYWFSKFIPKYSINLFNNLVSKIIDYRPDLVICTYRFIPIPSIDKLKFNLKHVPIVQLNPDQLTTFEKQQIFGSNYDHYFTKDSYIVDFMKNKMGLRTHYLPEAFNQRVHFPPKENREELENKTNIDVLVFGSIYPYRANMVKKLINAGINVTMFGDNQNEDVSLSRFFRKEWITGNRKSEILTGSKIIFNNFHYAEINSVNCKFFEIAGIGGFQICDYKPSIAEYSMHDVDRFTFQNIEQAIEKIKYYLDKPNLRHEMAKEQRAHFLEHHTYDIRVQQMLNFIFE